MRDTFVQTLTKEAEKNRDIILVTGDLGFGVLNKFWDKLPDQFINAGVAEQAMTGLAVGMALEGKTVFTYSIANFPTLRCLEQIRNDSAYHNANVKIVAVGGGFAYGSLGMSHHATEDIAVMRAIPDILLLSPGDPYETVEVTKAAIGHKGTVYIRLGRGGEKNVHDQPLNSFEIGKAIQIQQGEDVYIFSTGAILGEAKEAAAILNREGISTGLVSFPTIKPIDRDFILQVSNKVSFIFTVEEHNIIGGLGSAVAEVIAENADNETKLIRIGLSDTFSSIVGDQKYLRDYYGMSADKIIAKVKMIISKKVNKMISA